jgi:hypothetical protein
MLGAADVHVHVGYHGAVIDECPRVHGLEELSLALPWAHERRRCAAAAAIDRMHVDVVHQLITGRVLEGEVDGIAFADPNHGAGDLPVESAKAEQGTRRDLGVVLVHGELHLMVEAVLTLDGRRDGGGIGHYRLTLFHAAGPGACGGVLLGAGGAQRQHQAAEGDGRGAGPQMAKQAAACHLDLVLVFHGNLHVDSLHTTWSEIGRSGSPMGGGSWVSPAYDQPCHSGIFWP